MKGWKGYLGAGLTIVVGVYLLAIGETVSGLQLIGIGLALLGIRHKLDYSENCKCKEKRGAS